MENKKNRELYNIYLELGHEVLEEKIKKPMELYLHASSNIISMNSSSLADSVGPPSVEVCRTAASFPRSEERRVGKECRL